jgi:hypothetical protein
MKEKNPPQQGGKPAKRKKEKRKQKPPQEGPGLFTVHIVVVLQKSLLRTLAVVVAGVAVRGSMVVKNKC